LTAHIQLLSVRHRLHGYRRITCSFGHGYKCQAVILDGFSRGLVGWAMAPHLDASLAVEALDQALADRKPMADDHSAPQNFR
jgi:transposase InsO family protein